MRHNAKVVNHNGTLKIEINGKSYNPLSFKSFRPNPQNISEFYNAGVRLFSVLSSGVTSALGVPYSLYGESWIETVVTISPQSTDRWICLSKTRRTRIFAPMLQLDTRNWYLKEHPEVPNSFTNLSQIACDEAWKKAAADYMKATIEHIEAKYGDKVYGYFLLCGTTTEWFSDYDFEVPNLIKNTGYKIWRKDNSVKSSLPDVLEKNGDVFLGADESEVYLARKFHNEIIADLILYFAHNAQEILQKTNCLAYTTAIFLNLAANVFTTPAVWATKGIPKSGHRYDFKPVIILLPRSS